MLDWELSTLGDPLADFTYLLMHWAMPPDGRSGLAGARPRGARHSQLRGGGRYYCARTDRAGIPALDWYFAYSLFRLAGILQGIAKRVVEGTAASGARARLASGPRRLPRRRGALR